MTKNIMSMIEIFATTRVSPKRTAQLLKTYYPGFDILITEYCIELFEKDGNKKCQRHWQNVAAAINDY